MSRRKGPCYSCGTLAKTRDHVFPKSLYVQRPANTLTVPACDECQKLTESDELHFRDFVVSTSYGNEKARELWGKVRRSFTYDPPRGRAFLEAVRPRDVYSNGGVYLGTVQVLEGDREQINRTLRKIVRGLWNSRTGKVMPAEELTWHFEQITPDTEPLPEVAMDVIRSHPSQFAGPEVEYRFITYEDDPRVTLTWMTVYGLAMFVASTSPAAHDGG